MQDSELANDQGKVKSRGLLVLPQEQDLLLGGAALARFDSTYTKIGTLERLA